VGAVGGSTALTATASPHDAAALTFVWSTFDGALDIPIQNGNTSSVNFTCPSDSSGTFPVSVTVNDGVYSECPTTDNTAITLVTCPSPPPPPPPEGGAGGADAASSPPDAEAGPPECDSGMLLVPCTAAGQSCCVPCASSPSGLCTQTEALLVAHDIAAGHATPAGEGAGNCYGCLVGASCIDDTKFGDVGHECEDLSGTIDAGARAGTDDRTLCLDALSCMISSSCASMHSGVAPCFCGAPAPSSASCGAGACRQPIADGFGVPVSDPGDVLSDFTDRTKPGGMATGLLNCAVNNGCAGCFD
jgi:hypothetical protein